MPPAVGFSPNPPQPEPLSATSFSGIDDSPGKSSSPVIVRIVPTARAAVILLL